MTRFDHPPNLQLTLLEADPDHPEQALWAWTMTCLCGQPMKGHELGTEQNVRRAVAGEICSTCYSEAMD